MNAEAIRRHRVSLGLALILLIVWVGSGIRRTDGEGRVSVLDSPVGLLPPRVVTQGWQFAPPGLGRISSYPVSSATLPFEAGGGETPLLSREGIPLQIGGLIRYRVDPERVLEIHLDHGPDLERDTLTLWIDESLRGAVARSDYGTISGARVEDLQAEVGRALGERLRAAGLVLLSCELADVRIRTDRGADAVAAHRVPGMKVLLIGLDGADWNILDPLIESGKVPHLARLVRGGVRGRLRSITPMLSPVIWTSIATGVLPSRHGIVDFVATTDREGERVPVSSSLRRVKAIWNMLSEVGVSVGVAGWWASFPAERVNGFVVSDRVAHQLFGSGSDQPREGKVYPPGIDDLVMSLTREPETITSKSLSRYLRLGGDPASLPTDEIKMVEDFKTLLAAGDTYAAISVELAREHAPDFQAFYLEGTDTVAHLFMPYAPPPLAGVGPAGRRRYGRAVSEYYRHADELIGRLLEVSAPTAVIVCSDHGFRTGENRPLTSSRIGYGPAADWHRKYGLVILWGDGFRAGTELNEASVLDVAPTILALFGLPVGEDMDGRPMTEAFTPAFLREHPISYIPTYEDTVTARLEATTPGAGGPRDDGALPTDPRGDSERIEKLRSLGYLGVDTPNSHNNRGLIFLGEGQLDAAISEFEQAVRGSEILSVAWLNMARAFYKKKDYAAAARSVNQLLTRQGDSPEAGNLLGNIAMAQGLNDQAETHFRRALDLNPNFTDALNSIGILHDRLGRHEEALEEFARVVAIDADYAEAYNNIGAIHKRQGRLLDAMTAFRQAIAADPAFSGSYSNLALAYEEQDNFASAAEHFEEGVRRTPGSAAVRANYGAFLYRRGEVERARTELEKAVELDPDYAPARNNLGAVYGWLGRADDELAAYRAAVDLDHDYADALHNLGLALLKRGDLNGGESGLRRALEVDPRYGPAYVNLGRLLLGQGKTDEALGLLSRGTEAARAGADVYALLGEAYMRLGRRDEAVAAFQKSIALRPGQPDLKRRIDSLLEADVDGEGGAPERRAGESR